MLDTAKMEAQFAPLVANFFASFYYCNTSTGCPASGMYVNDLCVWGWGWVLRNSRALLVWVPFRQLHRYRLQMPLKAFSTVMHRVCSRTVTHAHLLPVLYLECAVVQ